MNWIKQHVIHVRDCSCAHGRIIKESFFEKLSSPTLASTCEAKSRQVQKTVDKAPAAPASAAMPAARGKFHT